jgi:hypothetical protein
MSRNGKAGQAPANGKPVRWDAVDLYRVTDGKISEEWAADDVAAIMAQIGAFSPQVLARTASKDGELPVSVAEQEPGIRGAIRSWRYAARTAEGIFSALRSGGSSMPDPRGELQWLRGSSYIPSRFCRQRAAR